MAEKDPLKYFQSEIKRLNYYNSQFLKEDDFRDEQLYHQQMRYFHNRALHTWGIVSGLEVKAVSGGGRVNVTAGSAIDRLGREIVLPAQSDAVALDAFAANARVYITIKYAEVFDPADKDPSNKGTESTATLYTRTAERPELRAATAAPPADAPEVVLAVVVLDKDKAIAQIETAARRSSGSRFGSSADGKEFSLYADSAGAWHFSDAAKGADRLTIDGNGNVGLGTASPLTQLHLRKDVKSALGPILTLMNGGGLAGAGAAIDFDGYTPDAGKAPSARLQSLDDGKYSSHFSFLTKQSGADANELVERLRINSSGEVGIGRNPVGAKLDVNGEVRSTLLRIADADGNLFPDNWIGMADNLDGATRWLHVGGITDGGERRLALVASLTYLSGNVGIGTSKPRTALDTGKGLMSGAANDYVKAQFLLSGGGTVTWSEKGGRYYLKWSNRFIAISMAKTPAVPSGYIDIYMPKSDIPAAQVYDGKARSVTADGVFLNDWEALYAVHNVGGPPGDVSFQLVTYNNKEFNAPSNWILVGVTNWDDKSIKLGTGVIVGARSSIAKGNGLPCGAIVLWSGGHGSFPDGWALCDGNNGTPDLRDRFVVGAGGNYDVWSKGGEAAVTLSVAQMPAHNHQNGGYDQLLHIAGSESSTYGGGGDVSAGEPCLRHAGQLLSAGGNQAHENRPPYYALCYIMKIF
jgi:microcystin-dependent protein